MEEGVAACEKGLSGHFPVAVGPERQQKAEEAAGGRRRSMTACSLPLRKGIKREIAKKSIDYRINQAAGITQESMGSASTRSGNVGYITMSTTERCSTWIRQPQKR